MKETQQKTSNNQPIESQAAGIGYSALFGLALGGMFVVQKLAQDSPAGINMFHMIFVRQSMLLLMSYGHAKAEGQNLSWMGYNAYSGLLLAFSIQFMPVSQSVSLSRLQVFFTPLLAFFVIKERMSLPEILTIAGGFTGVMLIMNPSWFNTNHQQESKIAKQAQLDQMKYPFLFVGFVLSILFAIVSTICVIIIRIQNRNQGGSAERLPVSLQVYFYGVFTTCFVIIAALFVSPEIFQFHKVFQGQYCISLSQVFWYSFVGLLCWTYILCAPKALKIVKSNTFVPFTNVAIVISFIFDIFYFKRLMVWSDYLGSVLIIACTVCLAILAEYQTVKSNDDDYMSSGKELNDQREDINEQSINCLTNNDNSSPIRWLEKKNTLPDEQSLYKTLSSIGSTKLSEPLLEQQDENLTLNNL